MKHKLLLGIAACLAGGLALSGCAANSGGGDSSSSGEDSIEIGFFGFSAANSFAQAVYKGVEEAATDAGAKSTFVDGQFDGQLQVQQINDAITSKRYDVIIIEANDNLAVQEPLKTAVDAGITVVVEFAPVGPALDSADPQVDGAISFVDPPVANGEALAELASLACAEVGAGCKVAYMEGNPALPLDKARTDAVLGGLKADSNIEALPTVTGGYSQDEGRAAFQDIIQATPDVDVVIGSSQAVAGAALAAGADSGIKFIGNGTPESGVQKVRNGEWFGVYALDVVGNGRKAAELGIAHAKGETVEMGSLQTTLSPNNGLGTKEALDEADFVSGYDE